MNTDTMDLPVIDPDLIDAAPRTDVAVAEPKAPDLAKVDIHDLVRAKFKALDEAAATAKKELATVVLDLSTQTKITEAKSLRERRINGPIAEVRKLGKSQRSTLSQAGKTSSSTEERIVGDFTEAGASMTLQIDAAQKKLDDEKEAKRLMEESRLTGLRNDVDQIMQKWLDRCQVDGITAERIGTGMAMLSELAMPPELADVAAHWNTAKAATVAAMTKLQLDKLLADKAERDREDADIDRLNELANDCVARGSQHIEDALDEFDNVLELVLSPAPRVQAVATAARARMVALLETAQEVQARSDRMEAERKEPEEAQARASVPVAAAIADALKVTPPTGVQAITRLAFPMSNYPIQPQPIPASQPARVIRAEPESEDDTLALLDMALVLAQHALLAFNGKFPSHPKPDEHWFDILRGAAEVLEPRLQAAIEAREVA